MAIPTKGSRKIIVNGEAYKWLIRRKATRCQEDYGNGVLHVAVEHSLQIGSTLVIGTGRPHPHDYATREVIPVTPRDVAFWIEKAISNGWQPKEPGPQFILYTSDIN